MGLSTGREVVLKLIWYSEQYKNQGFQEGKVQPRFFKPYEIKRNSGQGYLQINFTFGNIDRKGIK